MYIVQIINDIDAFVWGPPMIVILLGALLFLTIRTGFVQRKLLTQISDYLSQASCALEQLKPLMERVDSISGVKEMALAYRTAVVPAMAALRATVDEAETQTAAGCWPYPTYGELLFSVR